MAGVGERDAAIMLTLWTLKEKLLAYLIALADARTPAAGKVFAILSIVYVLSPIDLLIDSIPLAGFLDDLVIVPLGVWLSSKSIPPDVLADAQRRAQVYRGKLNVIAGVIVALLVIWILLIVTLLYFVVRALFF